MKKSLIYSLILHILIISLALFITHEKKGTETKPFYAAIITADELKKGDTSKKGGSLKDAPSKKTLPAAPRVPAQIEARKVPEQKDIMTQKQDLPTAPSPQLPPVAVIEGAQQKSEAGRTGGDRDTSISTLKQGQGGRGENERAPGQETQKIIREKLFDKDIIGKLAQREQKEIPKPDSGITFDAREFKYYGYMQRLKEKIENIWRYPKDAAEKGIYGDLLIRFTIKKNGQLGAVELIRTSGYKSLDDAAIKALRDAEPFWPLPEEWKHDGFTITGHFVYSLYGVYVR